MPYLYCSVKSKCYRHAEGRVCSKPGHSCLRKIISWRRYPARGVLRMLSKALQVLARVTGLSGAETLSLRTSAQDVRKVWSNLRPPPGRRARCLECSARLEGSSIVVADAAQMFEALDPIELQRNVRIACAAAQREGYTGVKVLRSRRLRGWLATTHHAADNRSRYLSFAGIEALLQAAVTSRCFLYGDTTWEQVTGVPIGGLISKAAATIVPGGCEATWPARFAAAMPRCAAREYRPHETWATVRYTDDILCLSRALCVQCLQAGISKVYASSVTFDVAETSTTHATWLDFVVCVHGNSIRLVAKPPDLAWLTATTDGPPTRWPVAPRLPGHRVDFRDLRSRRLGREARWVDQGLGADALRAAVMTEVVAWRQAGWPWKVIRKVWTSQGRCPAVPVLARRMLQSIRNL